jgi:hypothetical protein
VLKTNMAAEAAMLNLAEKNVELLCARVAGD